MRVNSYSYSACAQVSWWVLFNPLLILVEKLHFSCSNTTHKKICSKYYSILLQGPGSNYIEYMTPENDSVKKIKSGNCVIFKRFTLLCYLIAIVCGGTAVSTGANSGTLYSHLMELEYDQSLNVWYGSYAQTSFSCVICATISWQLVMRAVTGCA